MCQNTVATFNILLFSNNHAKFTICQYNSPEIDINMSKFIAVHACFIWKSHCTPTIYLHTVISICSLVIEKVLLYSTLVWKLGTNVSKCMSLMFGMEICLEV